MAVLLGPRDSSVPDGEGILVREVTPTDEAEVRALYTRISVHSVYLRYFSAGVDLNRAVDDLLRPAEGRELVVALLDGQLVGVAGYDRLPDPACAEVAFLVEDARQHLGVATALLQYLIAEARTHGITRFVAQTLVENVPMLRVFSHCGLDESTTIDGSVVTVTLSLDRSRSPAPGRASALGLAPNLGG